MRPVNAWKQTTLPLCGLVAGAYQKDNLHLDHKGYEIFAEAIALTITEWMGK